MKPTAAYPIGALRAINAWVAAGLGWLVGLLFGISCLGAAAESFFPIGVWLQHPTNAVRYRAAGINTYVALWHGPTEAQLHQLQRAGLRVVCHQNEIALNHPATTNILAWMHTDEPDNSTTRGARFGFGSPIPPEQIQADYRRMKAADPTRPVLLNLGQGVAWDGWYGRGRRNNHPEDYPEYLKGCDIASFDIYPVNHSSAAVAGNLWFVAAGVTRLRQWSNDTKPVWNCIETTWFDRTGRKPTPTEVRAQVWMSLIHGSRGILYFVHQFKPTFVEAALLADAEMLPAVTTLNHQITALAPVLNSPTIPNAVTVQSTNASVPIATMVKQHQGFTYLFAVAMRPGKTTAKFTLENITPGKVVEVLGEHRTIPASAGAFADDFGSWAVHLYRVESDAGR